jgi:hypothetical protein
MILMNHNHPQFLFCNFEVIGNGNADGTRGMLCRIRMEDIMYSIFMGIKLKN